MSKLLVVLGATGQQGGSVVETVLADPQLSKEYRIRGTTRDPQSAKAQALAARGVEPVSADVNDPASLRAAFVGAYAVFASTVTVYDDGHAYEHEVAHGRAVADAVQAAGVPYLVYSTLPNAGQISGGKLWNMGHFDGKAEAEQYIRALQQQPPGGVTSAFIAPGCFMSNFHASMAPHPDPAGDGTYALAGFVGPRTQVPLIATADDTGKWVAAILADFPRYAGRVISCATAVYTLEEIVDAMSRASGKTVVYKQLPRAAWEGFLPETMRAHISEMMQYFEEYGYYGENTAEKVREGAAQARGKLTTVDEYLQAHPLNLA